MTIGIRDLTSHAPPAIVYPPAGGTYKDPIFGTSVTRVTDETMGKHCVHYYHLAPALSVDDTRLLVGIDGEAWLFSVNSTTGKTARLRAVSTQGAPPLQFEGAQWDRDNRDVLYGLDADGTRLWRVNVTREGAPGFSVIKDFATDLAPGEKPWELCMSEGGQVFAITILDASRAPVGAAAWDRRRGAFARFAVPAGKKVKAAKISKSGAVVQVTYMDSSSSFWLWQGGPSNCETWELADAVANVAGHWDLGYSLYANGDGVNAGIVVRRPDSPLSPRAILHYVRADGAPNWKLVDHVSLRARDESCALVSTYDGDGTWAPFEKEIVLARTDGSGFVRLAHSRSTEKQVGDWNYYSQPRAVISASGKWAVWTSDLGDPARHDVMLMKVPPAAWGPA
jgi:hypothetical protein